MTKSVKTIKQILGNGASVSLRTADFNYAELLEMAVCAFSNSAKLTLTVGDDLAAERVLTLAEVARDNLHIVFP